MALRLPDHWLWDFWVVSDGDDYHVFYLQAPRSIGDPEKRHWNVSIGHAVSTDLVNWDVLADALSPGAAGAWDGYTTWTGSVVRHHRAWAMLYTGTAQSESGLVQRVGLAWSEDLVSWTKDPANPVLEIDPLRYEELDLDVWHDQAWRDPWVFVDPDDGRFHVLLTARTVEGLPDLRGVVAHAVSDDLVSWIVLEPITRPGVFGHLEIPQLVEARGKWYLVFSAPASSHPSAMIGDFAALTGTHYMSADAPTGPFEWKTHGVLLADEAGTWYGTKLVPTHDGSFVALAWGNTSADGEFLGSLSDPMEVRWSDGPSVSGIPGA